MTMMLVHQLSFFRLVLVGTNKTSSFGDAQLQLSSHVSSLPFAPHSASFPQVSDAPAPVSLHNVKEEVFLFLVCYYSSVDSAAEAFIITFT